MSVALHQGARSSLERFVQRARHLLEEDLGRQAEGRFGIHVVDGEIEDEGGLHLDMAGLDARRDIVEVLGFLRREEPSGSEAVGRLIREASFTHLNRLVAIRIAEEIELLPESLTKGSNSAGFREILEVSPLLAHDPSGGYWRYLQLCGDELAADLPQLFDPRNPLLELAPSASAFEELVDMMGVTDLNEVWDAPDALGWAYQFFNNGDERRAMRDASAAPRNSRELAVRNQFFTPRYVVDFLVHNSLGRRLLEADPKSPLVDCLPLLLDPPSEKGRPIDLSEIRVIDPACGSGHFLLGAYDVLERAWEIQGVSPENAAPHIVSSLWGIDIDARCAQVAAAAVVLRARRHCKTHELPIPNILTARALPEPIGGWESLLAELPDDRRQLVAAIRDALVLAPLLGPLLKVDEIISSEIRARIAGADDDPNTLFGSTGLAEDAFGRAEAEVLMLLQSIADSATSGPAERIFVAEAQDAIRFVEAMRQRYDAVLMNPPFGEPARGTKEVLRAAYPFLPGSADLFAAFVARGHQLLRPGGSVAAITSRVGLFLTTFEKWRREILLRNDFAVLADLGLGVMEQAMVEAAAYVVRSAEAAKVTETTCVRSRDISQGLADAVAAARKGEADPRIFRVSSADISLIPGAPFAYWAHPDLRNLFRRYPALEGGIAEAKMGLSTGDDVRFVRLWWEINGSDSSWVPYSKGGEYSPFYFEPHLLVDWAESGDRVRNSGASWVAVRNESYYFRPGISWPRRTGSGFGPRLLPRGCVFGDKGPTAFAADESIAGLLAWLLSRPVSALLSFSLAAANEVSMETASKSYEVGLIQKLPWAGEVVSAAQKIAEDLVDAGVSFQVRKLENDETSRYYCGPRLTEIGQSIYEVAEESLRRSEDDALHLLELSGTFDESITSSLGLEDDARNYLSSEVNLHPWDYNRSLPSEAEQAEVEKLWGMPVIAAVNELLESGRGSRAIAQQNFIADRRIEVISHGLALHPSSVVSCRRNAKILPPGNLERVAEDFLSFIVGEIFGRWSGPFPAQLVNAGAAVVLDGLPVSWAFHLAGSGQGVILLDEPGHTRDLVSLMEAAGEKLPSGPAWLTEAVDILGATSVRSYMRSQFFRSHLSRYSKSRRKAPIYWPLTVPSGGWGVWVYAPAVSRENLYGIAAEALRREGQSEAEILRLERERLSGGAGRGLKALDGALDSERKLGEELRRFREEAERIANLGWEPDLNDGIALCAAPLAELFPMWKEPALCRKEIRAGKYNWSTVSKWADQI
jgi:hypothetical protein